MKSNTRNGGPGEVEDCCNSIVDTKNFSRFENVDLDKNILLMAAFGETKYDDDVRQASDWN